MPKSSPAAPGRPKGAPNKVLNAQQLDFINAYVEQGFCGAAEAYLNAYPRSRHWKRHSLVARASVLLDHPLVAAEIAKFRAGGARSLAKIVDKYMVSKETIIARFAHIAFTDFSEVVTWKDGKIKLIDLENLSPAIKAAIARVRWNAASDKVVAIELHNQQDALMNLARLHNLLQVEMATKGSDEDPIVIELRHTARQTFIEQLNSMEKMLKQGKIVDVETS